MIIRWLPTTSWYGPRSSLPVKLSSVADTKWLFCYLLNTRGLGQLWRERIEREKGVPHIFCIWETEKRLLDKISVIRQQIRWSATISSELEPLDGSSCQKQSCRAGQVISYIAPENTRVLLIRKRRKSHESKACSYNTRILIGIFYSVLYFKFKRVACKIT